jgi:uncharacterized protein RhaS with RHS repeats
MYDPRTGSWTSTDPLGFSPGDANLYRYVGNSPTGGKDPGGLQEAPEITAKVYKLSKSDRDELFGKVRDSGRVLKAGEITVLLKITAAETARGIIASPGQELLKSPQAIAGVRRLATDLALEGESRNRLGLGAVAGGLGVAAVDEEVKRNIRRLEDRRYKERMEATAILTKLAPLAIDQLKDTAGADLERRLRQEKILNEYLAKVRPNYDFKAFQKILGGLKAEEQRKVLDAIVDPDDGFYYAKAIRDWAKQATKLMEKKSK